MFNNIDLLTQSIIEKLFDVDGSSTPAHCLIQTLENGQPTHKLTADDVRIAVYSAVDRLEEMNRLEAEAIAESQDVNEIRDAGGSDERSGVMSRAIEVVDEFGDDFMNMFIEVAQKHQLDFTVATSIAVAEFGRAKSILAMSQYMERTGK